MTPFTYHCVPGERSRIAEVMRAHFGGVFQPWEETEQGTAADFVWAHTREPSNDAMTVPARVCSMLSFAEVLESKANLALLRPRLRRPATSLECTVVRGAEHLRAWCASQYGAECGSGGGVWALKDSASNGGDGLWCVHQRSWRVVVAQVAAFEASLQRRERGEVGAANEGGEELREAPRLYVLQRWVENPMLWQGSRKFHLRVYHVLLASGQVFSFRHAFAHVANRPWAPHSHSSSSFDRQIHLTNVSCNSKDEAAFAGFLGVDVPERYPAQWRAMQRALADVTAAAAPFLAAQAGAAHFAHIGGDWMLDDAGGAWLLELNCPPCMFAYDGEGGGGGGSGSGSDSEPPVHPHEAAVAPAMRRSTRALIDAFVLPVLRGDEVVVHAREGEELHGWAAANGAPAVPKVPVAHAEELALNELAWAAYQMKLVSGATQGCCSGGFSPAQQAPPGWKRAAEAEVDDDDEEEEKKKKKKRRRGAQRQQRTIQFVAAAAAD